MGRKKTKQNKEWCVIRWSTQLKTPLFSEIMRERKACGYDPDGSHCNKTFILKGRMFEIHFPFTL